MNFNKNTKYLFVDECWINDLNNLHQNLEYLYIASLKFKSLNELNSTNFPTSLKKLYVCDMFQARAETEEANMWNYHPFHNNTIRVPFGCIFEKMIDDDRHGYREKRYLVKEKLTCIKTPNDSIALVFKNSGNTHFPYYIHVPTVYSLKK